MPRRKPFVPLPHGLGSIHEDAARGGWAATFSVTAPDGKRKRVHLRGDDPGDLKRRVLEYREQAESGRALLDGSALLADYAARWLRDVAAPRVRAHTQRAYGVQVRRIAAGIGHYRLRDLTAQHIRAWYATLALAPGTVQLTHAVLRMALGQAVLDELIARNPAERVSPPANQRTPPQPLTQAQTVRLLEVAAESGDRLAPLWVTLAYTGLRIGEALGLRWQDVDFEARRLNVRQQLHRSAGAFTFVAPKTGKSRRSLPLDATVAAALRAHRSQQAAEQLAFGSDWPATDLIFRARTGEPVHPAYAGDRLAVLLKRAGLPHIRPHDLRHGFASVLLAEGVPLPIVTGFLGHSSVRITGDIYSHVLPGVNEAAMDRFRESLERAGSGRNAPTTAPRAEQAP